MIRRADRIEIWEERFREYVINTDRPSVVGFCAANFLAKSTFYTLVKRSELLKELSEICATKQEDYLITNGLSGNTDRVITKLILSSNYGYTDRNEQQGNPDRPQQVINPNDVADELLADMEKKGEI